MKKFFFYAVAIISLTMLAACNSNDSVEESLSPGRKQRALTITQNIEATAAPRTTQLIDKGEDGLAASWEMGDVMSVYNKTYPASGYENVTASSSTKNTTFTGMVTCEQGDVLRFFYPAIGTEGSVTGTAGNLTLNIANQTGTLEDIQQHFDFNYGEAIVTAVTDETATANAGTTDNLMAICKFNFKCDGAYLKSIKSVDIAGVATTATFSLSARNTPELIPGTTSILNVASGNADNYVYVTLFPGATTPTFTVTTTEGVYEGSLPSSTLAAGKFYNVTVNATRTGDAPASDDYVEVCGIKWARGNLMYDPINGGDEGFVENWRIAPEQWYYVSSLTESVKDNFNVLYLGDEAYSSSLYSKIYRDENYAACLYYYVSGTSGGWFETNSFEFANRGDVAYWASKGKYRLPTSTEISFLINIASYQYGYIESNGTRIQGVLFTTPNGERVTNKTSIRLEENQLDNGLFMPLAGRVYIKEVYNKETMKYTYSSTELQDTNVSGYFFGSLTSGSGTADRHNNSNEGLSITSSKLEKGIPTYKFVSESSSSASLGTRIHSLYRYKIRPVLCE